MPRPKKCRMVGFVPDNSCFNPELYNKNEIVLSIEEVESIRLSDYLEMEQNSSAESMNVSRGTFQRIINAARKKTADALINGKTIRINGGHYELLEGKTCCMEHKNNGHCKRKYCEKCEDCEHNKLE